MKKYEYILLDWDGNLAKTLDIWLHAVRSTMEKHGIHKSDGEIGTSFGRIVKHFQEWGLVDPWGAFVEADRIAKQMLPEVELYPDALLVLNELHRAGKHLALITTSPHENVKHLLEKYELQQLFDAIITGDDVAHHKPHPEPLEKALAELDGSKELAVMVGDSGNDLGAAQSFGVDSILFFPEEHHKFYDYQELCALKPTHVVDDFKRILETI